MVTGWRRIGQDPAIAAWAAAALPLARQALHNTDQPLRCGGTWAVGLDLLPNDATGAVGGVPLPWAKLGLSQVPLHAAQLSTIYPGYPQPSPDETPGAFQFRLNRDAAHLDGLLPIGPDKQRMIKEPHGWILGLPLTPTPRAPLVVWEGSHIVMQQALAAALQPYTPSDWNQIDVTKAYQAARALVFQTCLRVELPCLPGETLVLHRHLIHGVAPWGPADKQSQDARIIAYFRPLMPSVAEWLSA